MTVCPQCGGSFPEGDAFCRFCGCAAPKVEPPTPDDATNPYDVGARTSNSSLSRDSEPRDVPSNLFAAIKMCLTRGGAKGRSSRAEFWYWNIFVFFTVVLPFYAVVIPYSGEPPGGGALIAMAALILGIVVAKPTLDVSVRRFHDVGLIGIFPCALLLLIFPGFLLISFIFYLWFFCFWICLFSILIVGLIPGTKGPNKYGPPPIKRKAIAKDKLQNNGEVR